MWIFECEGVHPNPSFHVVQGPTVYINKIVAQNLFSFLTKNLIVKDFK